MERKKIKKLKNQYHLIIISLVVICVVLLITCFKLMKTNKTYMFNGSGEYIDIYNGVISFNSDMNLFEGSDIDYTYAKDFTVVKYKIGYYVKVGDKLKPLVVVDDEYESGLSLKKTLEGMGTFNVTELANNDIYFTKEKVKNIENGLYFIIEATDKKGNQINEQIELNVSKISK